MKRDDWCKHYNGIGNSPNCKVGVEYDTVKDTSQKPYRWCCIHPDANTVCALREEYTPEEIAERERRLREFIQKMNDIWDRTSEECPNCSGHVESAEQVGRSVYARPCGCRLGQGKLHKNWKT